MAYDVNKDKLLKLFEMKSDTLGNSLLISIFSYNNAKPKLQITRSYKKKDETFGYTAAGRLKIEEVEFIRDNINEIIEIMKGEKQDAF
jgi:hypothetical protein